MTSKSFSRAKQLRCKTRSLKKDSKFLKLTRRRNNRRIVKKILKLTHSDDGLICVRMLNNGSYGII